MIGWLSEGEVMEKLAVAIIFLTALIVQKIAFAADQAPSSPQQLLHGTYKRTGAGFACAVDGTTATLDQVSRLGESVCLWIGNLAIGETASVLQQMFGNPDQLIHQPNGSISQVYFLRETRGTYLVVTTMEGRIVALQISGNGPLDKWRFGETALGMPKADLIRTLGNPHKTEHLSDNGADLLSYAPFPFSFEVANDRVSSIRIAESDFF
jgi:hypothetical protein